MGDEPRGVGKLHVLGTAKSVGPIGKGPQAAPCRLFGAFLGGIGVGARHGVWPASVVGLVLVEHAAPADLVGFLDRGGCHRRGAVAQGCRRRGRARGDRAKQGEHAPPPHSLAVLAS